MCISETLLVAQEPPPSTSTAPASTSTTKEQPAAPKQDQGGKPASDETSRRLETIEKQLADLLKLIQTPRGGSANPPNSLQSQAGGQRPTTTPVAATTSPSAPAWTGELPKSWLKGVTWRNIGPANMGGRITDLAINPNDPSMWWAATASGGLIKTTNNGISFEYQFDKQATVSIGAVAVAASDPNIVWVGTGEANPRNSVSYGDGVYKSTDGGKTWNNMGLKKTFQIGEVVIHPKDPNIVYVAALGRLYGANEDRGVFKTTDGGATWNKVFYVDDRTGVMEMQMHPADPETLIITAWERLRDGFDSWPGNEVAVAEGYDGYDPIRKWGPGGGIYKTTDGGKNWKKLTKGLPSSQTGRIGIDYYQKDPNILFAIVDCEAIGKGPLPLPVSLGIVGADEEGKAKVVQLYKNSPAEKAGVLIGDIIAAVGESPITGFDQVLDILREKKPGDKISLSVARGEEKRTLEITLTRRGGQGGRQGAFAPGIWLGVLGEDGEGGFTLRNVIADGPMQKAGFQTGDVIYEIDGKPQNFEEATEYAREKKVGDKIKVKFRREDEAKEAEVTLEERPIPPGQQQQAPPTDLYLGLTGRNNQGGGARITEVSPGGPAEKAGVMAGDVVKEMSGKTLESYRALTEAIRDSKAGDKLKLKIARATEVKEIEITLEKRPPPVRPYTASYFGQMANVQDQQGAKGYEYGGVYKSVDGGESWTRINSVHSRPMYFSVIRVDPTNDQNLYLLGVGQFKSLNGGVTFTEDFGRGVHADGHALWIDPRDGRHAIIGVDGGVYVTYDRGANWDHYNTKAMGQFYHVAISPKYPYYVYGGLQDNGTWGGPSQSLSGPGPLNEDWLSVGGGDGFMCRVDQNDPDVVYWTSQNGAMQRRNMKTGERGGIRPAPVEDRPPYRFNWNTPFILSHANQRIFYAAGNYVFRSFDRGNNLEPISPEITLTKRGSATALSESPRNANVLYVGTDDGAMWVTQDGGKKWTEIGKNLNLPAPRWVATIEASRFADGRVYVCLDGHRSDDDNPYLFVSEDFGATWSSIKSNLPWGSTRCLREDVENENLLLVGTEFAVYASVNRGQFWNSLNTNLPTVPVFDFALHPNNGEIVAATHGRSLWIADLTPLRQVTSKHLTEEPVVYKSPTAIRYRREPARGGTNRAYAGTNPSSGATIYYALPKKANQVTVKITDAAGQTLRELRGESAEGLNKLTWDMTRTIPRPQTGAVGRGGQPSTGTTSGTEGAIPEGTAGRGPGAGGFAGGFGGGGPGGGRRFGGRRPDPDAAAGGASSPQQPSSTTNPPSATGTAPSTVPAPGAEATPQEGRGAGGRGVGAAAGGPGGAGFGGGGFGGGGFGGGRGGGGGRPAAPGTYRLILNVDGKEYSEEIRLISDPNLPVLNDLIIPEEEVQDESEGEKEEEEEEEERIRSSQKVID